MKKYSFTVDKNLNEVIQSLVKYGICHIPNYINENNLLSIQNQFDLCFNSSHPMVTYRHGAHATNPGMQIKVSPKIAKEKGHSELYDLLYSDFMNSIAKDFFGENSYVLNNVVRFTHLLPSKKAILPWHFDRSQTLKTWIYIKNASVNDGALEYCPGSHWEGKYRAGYHTLSGTKLMDIPNDIPLHRIQNPVTLEGNAGDLFIFDPDGFHRGGIIQKGHERKVIRADSHPIPHWNKKMSIFNPRRLLYSPLNIAKYLKKYGSRKHSSVFIDRAISRERNKEISDVK